MHKPRHQLHVRRLMQLAVPFGLLSACSFGTNLDNLYGEAPTDSGTRADALVDAAGADALGNADSTADAPLAPDTGSSADTGIDSGVDSGPRICSLVNLLSNGNFESGVAAPWTAFANNTSTLSTAAQYARSGAYGLALIRTGSDTLSRVSVTGLPIGGPFYARAYIKSSSTINTITFSLGDRALNVAADVNKFRCAELSAITMSSGSNSLAVTNNWSDGGSYTLSIDDVVVFAVPGGGMPPECTCAALP